MMKKNMLITVTLLAAVSLIACGKNPGPSSDEPDTEAATSSDPAASLTDALITDASRYVTLGDLSSLQLTKSVTAITDEDVDTELEALQYEYAEYQDVDRAAQSGDTLTVDLSYEADGKSTRETDYEIDLGYQEFGVTFDEELIGHKAGETVSFSVDYTEEDYVDEDWTGKTVNFTVTIDTVTQMSVPELTEQFVQDTLGYDSLADYREAVRQQLQDSYDLQDDQTAVTSAVDAAIDISTFHGYPQAVYDESLSILKEQYASMAELFGVSETELYEMYGMSDEDLTAQVEADVQRRLLISAVILEEKLPLTQNEVDETAEKLYSYQDYDSAESMKADLGKDMVWLAAEQVTGEYLLNVGSVSLVADSYDDDLGYVETEEDDVIQGIADESFGAPAETETVG